MQYFLFTLCLHFSNSFPPKKVKRLNNEKESKKIEEKWPYNFNSALLEYNVRIKKSWISIFENILLYNMLSSS